MSIIPLLLLSFLSHLTILNAQLNFTVLQYHYCFYDKGNYTNTSPYQTNLNTLLSSLTYNTKINYGFYNASYGQNLDKVSAIGLCRADVKPNDCRDCLKYASNLVQKACPNQKEALGGFNECMLRYSNRSILGVMEKVFSLYTWNLNNVTDVEKFDKAVNTLMYRLTSEAASGDSLRKFAAGNETGPNFQPVFGAVQCMPDLSGPDCTSCLLTAIYEIPYCCGTRKGGRIIKPSCNIRFESNRFFDYVEHAAQLNFTVLEYSYCFNDKGNYTNTSPYQTNLNTLLSSLTSNTKINYGFYNASYGQNLDKVSAIGLCRADVKPNDCRDCLKYASNLVRKACPNQKEALGGFNECMLRYSNRSILGVMDKVFSLYTWNLNNVTDVEKFDKAVNMLMNRLTGKAASGDSLRKFAAGNETGLNFQPVFGVVQCVPDLSGQDCTSCLLTAIYEIPYCCGTRKGGRIIKPSCNIRFESDRFFDYV